MSTESIAPYSTYLHHLRQGELAYQYSAGAAKAVFFPRVLCPDTGELLTEWRVGKGLGTVYSTTAVYPRQGDPYNVALVDCDEGFRLMTRVEGIAATDVSIGMRVQFAVHTPEGEDPYPVFHPVSAP
jgi:uncharacterized OB-fold protein